MQRYLSRLERGPFEAAIAFAGVVTLAAYFFDPKTAHRLAVTSVARTLLPWWEALYGGGGLLILMGMGLLSLRTEVVGLVVFSTALLVNSIAVVHFVGFQGFATLATFFALIVAAMLRIRFLVAAKIHHAVKVHDQ